MASRNITESALFVNKQTRSCTASLSAVFHLARGYATGNLAARLAEARARLLQQQLAMRRIHRPQRGRAPDRLGCVRVNGERLGGAEAGVAEAEVVDRHAATAGPAPRPPPPRRRRERRRRLNPHLRP